MPQYHGSQDSFSTSSSCSSYSRVTSGQWTSSSSLEQLSRPSSQESFDSIASRSWWLPQSSRRPSNSYRPPVRDWHRKSSSQSCDFEPGAIYNLLDWEKDGYNLPNLDGGIIGHPVALLDLQGEFARVMITSTLGGKTLRDFHKGSKREYNVHMEHIPIHPSPYHHITGEQLKLTNSRFEKASYLKVKDLHIVPIMCLRPYMGKGSRQQLKFTAESWENLKQWRLMADEDRQLHSPPPSTRVQSPLGRLIQRSAVPIRRTFSRKEGKRDLNKDWRPLHNNPKVGA